MNCNSSPPHANTQDHTHFQPLVLQPSLFNSSGSAGQFVDLLNDSFWYLDGMRIDLAAQTEITIDIMTVDFLIKSQASVWQPPGLV